MLTRLGQAVEWAHAAYDKAATAAGGKQRAEREHVASEPDDCVGDEPDDEFAQAA